MCSMISAIKLTSAVKVHKRSLKKATIMSAGVQRMVPGGELFMTGELWASIQQPLIRKYVQQQRLIPPLCHHCGQVSVAGQIESEGGFVKVRA